MDIDESEFDREEGKTHNQWHCDSQLHRLMELLKEKCEISSRQDKLRLLTLWKHHFIAKAQATYLKQQKENLDDETAIVLMDFAENFSFVVQDEVQGFHWDHSQATLHPFAVYIH